MITPKSEPMNRRTFLKIAGMTAGVGALAACVPAAAPASAPAADAPAAPAAPAVLIPLPTTGQARTMSQ